MKITYHDLFGEKAWVPPTAKVYLDGEHMRGVVEADESEGYVIICNAKPGTNPDFPVSHYIMHGKVEITL